ncbi:hypothetical protein SAMN02910369_00638 [Lachnospiraceae bacterium NE2001]|nr:hypothetical protein SAMN02910369_00638 [Lachnospiraceae bacterium NE2001]
MNRGNKVFMKRYDRFISKGLVISMLLFSMTACGSSVTVSDNSGNGKRTTEEMTEATTEAVAEITTEAATEAVTEAVTEATTEKADETEETEADTNSVVEAYYPILDEAYSLVQDGYDEDREYEYMSSGIMEEISYGDPDSLGYVFMDLNGDDSPELLIGKNGSSDGSETDDAAFIYEGYTLKNGKPVGFLSGWARSSYYWIGDDHFYYAGSGGAMNTAFGECHLSEEGEILIWDDFYFSDEKEGGEMGIYHNHSGVWDSNESEELTMSSDDFWAISEGYEFKLLEWNPLTGYIPSENALSGSSKNDGCEVTAVWADGVVDESTNYYGYEAPYTNEYTTHVLFSVNNEVKNFRIVELFVKNIDDDGNIEYLYEERYKLDVLTPDMPVCAGLNFPGDTPSNGFMYTDSNGNDHLFVLDVSGKDGSLFVWEY